MATGAIQQTREATGEPLLFGVLKASDMACGNCAFHIPNASTPDGWCAKAEAELRWHTVSPRREACPLFATSPGGTH